MCKNLAEGTEVDCAAHLRVAVQHKQLGQQKYAPDSTDIQQKCHGQTTKGKPCKSKGLAPSRAPFYCDAHTDQKPMSEDEISEPEEECGWTKVAGGDSALDASTFAGAGEFIGWSEARAVPSTEQQGSRLEALQPFIVLPPVCEQVLA